MRDLSQRKSMHYLKLAHTLELAKSYSILWNYRRFVRNEAQRKREEHDAHQAVKALNKNHDFNDLYNILGDFASLLPAVRLCFYWIAFETSVALLD